MPKSIYKIPLHQQDASAIGGLSVWHLTYAESRRHTERFSDHRDDYYILMIALKGSGTLHCDMETIHAGPKSIVVIKPYQVHSGTEISKDTDAYFISIAPFLMPAFCNVVFQNLSIPQQCLKLQAKQLSSILNTVKLLHEAFNDAHLHKTALLHHLFSALVYRMAILFSESQKYLPGKENRSYLISQQFKTLVSDFSFRHLPSFYARKLHITPAHLNDCVKRVTGLTVSQFLQEALILEAKRNLYYTNHDVKQIAYALGFEDHTYFSRLFKKITSETPMAFRKKFRE